MVCGLFSVFDPVCNLGSFGEWSVKWLMVLPMSLVFFWQMSPLCSGVELLKKHLVVGFLELLKSIHSKMISSLMIVCSLFLLILSSNLSGMVPMCLTPSSHPGWVVPGSGILFLGGVIALISVKGKLFPSQFLPQGSPLVLWVFLVIVESVSMMIRPLTLSIRLVANVMAGHLFMEMLSSLALGSVLFLLPETAIFSFLMGFEIAVSVVQAFVFTNLISMYWSESFSEH